MSELKKEEILNILETAFSHLLKDINYKETRTRYEQAKKQIKALIQRPGVTEEWIEEKAKAILNIRADHYEIYTLDNAKNFIRSLVGKIHGRK